MANKGSSTVSTGMNVFIPCKTKVWAIAEVREVTDKSIIVIRRDDNMTVKLSKTEQIHMCNPENLLENAKQVPDDLTQLTHLHEAAVLESLDMRYSEDMIYTFTGPILIAVNPFKPVKHLYTAQKIKDFSTGRLVSKPHLFSIANGAYVGICSRRKSQAILISGESGSGKTESTKYVMKFLANTCTDGEIEQSIIENQVLESNPLLEAFGNAKTLRNNNSSRFGKFIELQFEVFKGAKAYGRLCGARIQTYLLEKVRVCQQQEGERNFHIFYQLCKAASCTRNGIYSFPQTAIKNNPKVEPQQMDFSRYGSLQKYQYLTKSSCSTLVDVDDLLEFENTIFAMQTIGMSIGEQMDIFSVTMAVLCLGNIVFTAPPENSEASSIASHASEWLQAAAGFLLVESELLTTALTSRLIITINERIKKPLSVGEAQETRDALARSLYGALFLKIVHRANEAIGFRDDIDLFCGVLDIFGFECFQSNSFEQMCINFTNERLQFFFNNFVFKYEEALYKNEGIPWSRCDFPDNQDCVELFQEKFIGIFAMLDEECMVPNGSDRSFTSKMKRRLEPNKRFTDIKTNPNNFIIHHFAGPVTYSSDSFLDKNKDLLSEDAVQAINLSKSPCVSTLLSKYLNRNITEASDVPRRTRGLITVSSAFCEQLNDLMDRIDMTEPHFIRCIKPNEKSKPNTYQRDMINEQLKYGGVLEAVKVSRAGYPVRMFHKEFLFDFQQLRTTKLEYGSLQALSAMEITHYAKKLLDEVSVQYKLPTTAQGVATWAVGRTRCFFKFEAFDILSSALGKKRAGAATVIQTRYRCYHEHQKYQMLRKATIVVQCHVRSLLAKKELQRLKQQRAATIINAHIRGYLARKASKQTKKAIVLIQSRWRGYVGRRFASEYKLQVMASRIQSTWKMYLCRRYYKRLRHGVLKAQGRWRLLLAKRLLNRLKRDAREVTVLIGKIQDLEGKLADAHIRWVDKDSQYLKLSSRYANTVNELEKSQTELSTVEDKYLTASEALVELRETCNKQNAQEKQFVNEVEELKKKLKGSLQEVDELKSKLEKSKTENTKLTAGVHELKSIKLDYARQAEDLKKENEKLKTSIEAQDALVAAQQNEIATMSAAALSMPTVSENHSTIVNPIDSTEMTTTITSLKKEIELQRVETEKLINTVVENRQPLYANAVTIYLFGDCDKAKMIRSFLKQQEDHASLSLYDKWLPTGAATNWIRVSTTFKHEELMLIDAPSNCRLSKADLAMQRYDGDYTFILIDPSMEETVKPAFDILQKISGMQSYGEIHLLSYQHGTFESGTKMVYEFKQMKEEASAYQCHCDELRHLKSYLENLSIVESARLRRAKALRRGDVKGEITTIDKWPYSNGANRSTYSKDMKMVERSRMCSNEFLKPSIYLNDQPEGSSSGIIPALRIMEECPHGILCFGSKIDCLEYYYMAVGTSNGTIVIYIIYRSKMEMQALSKAGFNEADSSKTFDYSDAEYYRLPGAKKHRMMNAHTNAVTALYFQWDAKHLVSAGTDGIVKIWDSDSGKLVTVFRDKHPVRCCIPVKGRNDLFLCANQKGTIRVVNSRDGELQQKLELSPCASAMTCNATGTLLFVGLHDGTIIVYTTNEKLKELDRKRCSKESILSLNCVYCNAICDKLIALTSNKSVITFNVIQQGTHYSLHQTPCSLEISSFKTQLQCGVSYHGGSWWVAGTMQGHLNVVAVAEMDGKHAVKHKLHEDTGGIMSVAINPDNTCMASFHSSSCIVLWRRVGRRSS